MPSREENSPTKKYKSIILQKFISFISSWFVLSKLSIQNKHQETKIKNRRKQVKEIIFNIVLAVMFGVVPMPVIWKWMLWFVCWIGFIYIIFSHGYINRFPRKSKILIASFLCILFWVVFNSFALSMWMTEQANTSTGYLSPVYKESELGIKLEIGESGTVFNYRGQEPGTLFDIFGSKIKFRKDNKNVLLTTDVHDRTGALIVNIVDNEWAVSQNQAVSWEKNYTNYSLEVKDRRGRVVLQVIFLPDRIRLQGEWWDEYGKGFRMVPYNPTKKEGAAFIHLNPLDHPDEPHIEPIFTYPSNKHFGEQSKITIKSIEKVFLYRALKFYSSRFFYEFFKF